MALQHVLPNDFRRTRHLGFLHPNCNLSSALIQRLPGQTHRIELGPTMRRRFRLQIRAGYPSPPKASQSAMRALTASP